MCLILKINSNKIPNILDDLTKIKQLFEFNENLIKLNLINENLINENLIEKVNLIKVNLINGNIF